MARAAAEPTEQPTPRRLLKARRQGQVAQSRELSSALALVAVVGVVSAGAAVALARLLSLFHVVLSTPLEGPLALAAPAARAFDVAFALMLWPAVVALAVAALASMLQTRGLFAWRAVAPDLARLSPLVAMRRVFGPRTAVELGKGLVKVGLVGAVALASLGPSWRTLPRLVGAAPGTVLTVLGSWSRQLGLRVALAMLALGLLDALLAGRRHRRALMMTRDEAKRELKEAEGDPRHKAERQRLHRELGERRLVEDVPRADFVVFGLDVGLEHFAAAVRYDRAGEQAPVVVAKGERLLAARIEQLARDAGVAVHRDDGLARALGHVDEGAEVPEPLYEAIAELLRALGEGGRAPAPG
ncbi:MAG TPA: EscU/YscU/HrcU family type III secretion system export apparatus switch protein [Polyangia bacterium]